MAAFAYQKFSKVSGLVHLLHQGTIWSAFERMCASFEASPFAGVSTHFQRSSNVLVSTNAWH